MIPEDIQLKMETARREIIEAGRRLYDFRLVVGLEGNLSARLAPDRILTTPAGICKGTMRPEDLVLVNSRGEVIGQGRPSSELAMHLAIYDEREDVDAIVHGHPPYATAHAVAGRDLDRCLLPEIIVSLGRIPLSEYGTPSTPEVGQTVRGLIREHDALLLRNHGVVVTGRGVLATFHRLEAVEQLARISLLADLAGGGQPLSRQQVSRLQDIQAVYGLEKTAPACRAAGESPALPSTSSSRIPAGSSEAVDGDALQRIIAEEIARALVE